MFRYVSTLARFTGKNDLLKPGKLLNLIEHISNDTSYYWF